MKPKSAPMAAFIGTTPNIGTTTAAFSAAMRLAEATRRPIGYLCLNLKSAKLYRFLGVDEPEMTLDKLQPELRSASMTPSMLQRAMHALPQQPNLRILFGSVNREQAEFFSDKELEHLLDVAEQTFAFVVLDVGAYWDNAATVCSIRRASTRIVVTTGALSHFQEDGRRWIGEVSPLFQVQPEQYDCIVVRGTLGHAAFNQTQISRELGAASLGELLLTPALFASLDKGAICDWLKEDKGGKAAMAGPAKLLMDRHGLTLYARKERQPWYLKLMNMRGGVGSA